MRALVFGLLLSASFAMGQFFNQSSNENYENSNYGYFQNSSESEEFYHIQEEPNYEIEGGPGNAGEPTPVHQNIPILLLLGLGLGIYAYCIQKNKSSDCP
jgi:hypothetical protein